MENFWISLMPTITTSPGIHIYYSDLNPSGNPAVTLLHGLGANGDSWALQVPVLVNHGFRVLIPDLRGFGKSTYSGISHTIRDMAADVIALMNSVALSKSDVVGISMGGTVALQLAYEYPYRVQCLILVNTFSRLRPRSVRQLLLFASRIALLYTLGLPAQARYVTNRLFPDPDQAHLREALKDQIIHANPQGYRATIRALAKFNISNRLADINNPTLVITGEKDRTVTPDSQRFLSDHIAQAQQVIIPGAGHGVTGEKPEMFNQELIKFLEKNIAHLAT
jgi:3-oxoadipate enol-lactonase